MEKKGKKELNYRIIWINIGERISRIEFIFDNVNNERIKSRKFLKVSPIDFATEETFSPPESMLHNYVEIFPHSVYQVAKEKRLISQVSLRLSGSKYRCTYTLENLLGSGIRYHCCIYIYSPLVSRFLITVTYQIFTESLSPVVYHISRNNFKPPNLHLKKLQNFQIFLINYYLNVTVNTIQILYIKSNLIF